MRSSKARSVVYGGIKVFGSVLFVLVAAEVVLRFFPVEMSARTMALNAESPVLRGPPNTRFSHSVGWNFRNPNSGRINNDGFVNDHDYHRDGPRPLIAVIGDSYVEAKMVPYQNTIQGRLVQNMKDSGRVYSFAMSGAPLSQYLVWIKYARDTYAPDAFIIVVVSNDFDESHIEYSIGAGFYHYAEDKDGVLRLRMTGYNPSFWKTVALKSALARYLAFHLRVREAWAKVERSARQFFGAPAPQEEISYIGNTLAVAGGKRQALSLAVVDAFFRDLPEFSGLPPERLLFVVDGLRASIYAPENEAAGRKSYFATMRRYFIKRVVANHYAVIDLHEVFSEDYRENGKRFEFDVDAHWSGYGHGVAARGIMDSLWYTSLLSGD